MRIHGTYIDGSRMASTLVEKIFSRKCNRSIKAGDVVMAPVDMAMIHDITGPLAVQKFQEMGGKTVFDPERIVLLFDHQVPADSISAAENHAFLRKFAREQNVENLDEREGICHQVVMERGRAAPGEIIVGADSHTCMYGAAGAFATGIGSTDMGFVLKFGALYFRVPETIRVSVEGEFPDRVGPKDLILDIVGRIGSDGATYQALEFTGDTFRTMEMPGRMTCCNMAVEMGAKAGIVPPDAVTWEYLAGKRDIAPFPLSSDENASFSMKYTFDASRLAPRVAVPHNVDQVVDVTKVAGTHIDQVFIGSCTNGQIEDLRDAASILKGRKAAKGLRLIVIPSTPAIYRKAIEEGIVGVLLDAGAVIGPPCCGPCLGGHMGILAEGERALSTTNRNFIGRMGHPKSEVYLANPFVAAASAVLGRIGGPDDL